MEHPRPVFEEIYRDYLRRLETGGLPAMAARLGLTLEDGAALVPLFGRPHLVSSRGVRGPDGAKPSHARCVTLCQYLLSAPAAPPPQGPWVSYRDFNDARPFAQGFADTVEAPLIRAFDGRPEALAAGLAELGGRPATLVGGFDVAMELAGLPGVPLLVAFNEAFPPLPPAASVLFRQNAPAFLDAECRAMLGMILVRLLGEEAGSPAPTA